MRSATRSLLAGLWVVLSVTAVEARERVYYYHNDHLGTPQAMSDAAGSKVWEAEYEPFGKAAVNEDPDGDGMSVINNLRFPGQYYDAETGLHYNYHRDYQPETGRYLQPDPIGLLGGLNPYRYALNNPINFIDPLGLYGRDVHLGLTLQLAIKAGFSREAAWIIAAADQGMDEGYFTKPEKWIPNILFGGSFHFKDASYAHVGLMQAENKCDLKEFGKFLHVLQDSYSHEGYNYLLLGHGPDTFLRGIDPDIYDPASARDSDMRDATLMWLEDFKSMIQ